jgi:hypothetical protein
MRHLRGAVVLLLGRTSSTPASHMGSLFMGGSILAQAKPTVPVREQFHNGLLVLAKTLVAHFQIPYYQGYSRIEHTQANTQRDQGSL